MTPDQLATVVFSSAYLPTLNLRRLVDPSLSLCVLAVSLTVHHLPTDDRVDDLGRRDLVLRDRQYVFR